MTDDGLSAEDSVDLLNAGIARLTDAMSGTNEAGLLSVCTACGEFYRWAGELHCPTQNRPHR